MNIISLDAWDLSLAAMLVLVLAGLSFRLQLGASKHLLVAALRTAVQLTLIGLVLKFLFANVHLAWMLAMATIMLLVAGREVMVRQQRRFSGPWGYGLGTISMFVSSFSVTLVALLVMVKAEPWYTPQYAIPLLGMVLGNAMNGVALGLDRLTQGAWQQRRAVEAQLLLGFAWHEAIAATRMEAMRAGMMPIINAMTAAGVVSLPGMMTGQILAGAPPVEAVKYQILIMFLIAACTGFGTLMAVWLGSRHLFDKRQRLRLDRLQETR